MKQLELTVKIEQFEDREYPYEITVHPEGKTELSAWFIGKTLKDTIKMYVKSFSEKNLRYWFMLEDK